MFNKRSLILLSTLIPLLAAVVLLSTLRLPVAMAASGATIMMMGELNQTGTTPIIVTSTLSSGAGTLRQAITGVCDGGLITFDAPLSDQTIDISPDGELIISKSLTISGSVPITVSGGNVVRVFNVMTGTAPTVDVVFDGLTIANGNVQTDDCEPYPDLCGGGIMIQSNGVAVTVTNSALISNTADGLGGGIYNNGKLTVNDSIFSENSALFDVGGGIYNSFYGTATVISSTFSENLVDSMYGGSGGGIYNDGTMAIRSSVFFTNSATSGGGIGNGTRTMTISDSIFFGNSATVSGGGISNHGDNAIITITNSSLLNNSAEGGSDWGENGGGGIFNHGYMTINDSTLLDNSTTFSGGGIWSYHSNIAINNSVLSDNSAGHAGGGIFGRGIISNSTVSGNSAAGTGGNGGGGGGIFGSGAIINSIISENSAAGTGGGITWWGTISNSIISGNSAGGNGGGIYSPAATISNSTIAGNSSGTDGGGIYGDGTINNSTVSGNSAVGYGGGIVLDGYGSIVNNSTVTDNRAGIAGGGIGGAGNGVYDMTIMNAIVSGNVISGSTTPDDLALRYGVTDSFISGGYNLVGTIDPNVVAFIDGVNGDQVGVNDPRLSPLADNGGSTLTHAVLPGSPAIDAGDPAYPVQAGDYDQRGDGFDRVVNGRLDIGAYEFQEETAVYSLTINIDGAGSVVCNGGCLETYPESTEVTLTAVSSITSTFTGWSGAITSTQNSITLTMDAAKTVTATFDTTTYTIFLPAIIK